MNISDEAVEAAAKVNYEARTGKEWRFLDNFQRPIEISWMRRTLEAAAPYLMAATLQSAADEFDSRLADGTGNGRAYNSYQVARMLRNKADSISTNPYRSQA